LFVESRTSVCLTFTLGVARSNELPRSSSENQQTLVVRLLLAFKLLTHNHRDGWSNQTQRSTNAFRMRLRNLVTGIFLFH